MKKSISIILTLTMILSLFASIPVQASESWMWPTSKNAVITSGYGNRNGKSHNGLDIGGTHGKSPIYASKSGTVVASYDGCTCRSDYSKNSEYYNGSTCRHGKTLGNYVIINHGNGIYTRYMHLYWKGVATVGTKVAQGDIIGYIGSTGRSSGVHLHFEIKTGGTGVSGGAILNGTYVNTNKSNINYVYTPGVSSGETVTPPVHTHSYSYSNDSAHPHSEYKYCSCGHKEYTGIKKLITSCQKCCPVGNVKLTREIEKTKGTATFYRNNVSNATSYTLKLYHNGSFYDQYTMSSDEYYVRGLPSGGYDAILYAKNLATGEERSDSCESFKIVETYTISYNANGGSNAPSSHEKLQDNNNFTLKTQAPIMTHHIFKGWARSKNATVAEYQPGDIYSRNAKVTLYAVWEPKIYTVTFDTNGGVGSIESKSFTYGDTIKMPNSTTKDFSYLKGWSTNKNATTPEYNINLDYKIEGDLTLYAVWGKTNWSGEVANSYAGGSGTSTDPYLIENSAQLALLAKHVNSQTSFPEYKYYKLISNIDLGYNNWVPIGIGDVQYQKFCGEFNGDGYTISGLYISGDSYNYIGLFGRADSATIKNFTLSGGDIEDVCYTGTNSLYLGGVVGNGNVDNVTVKDFNISSVYSAVESYSKKTCIGIVCGEGTVLNCDVISSYILDCTSGSNLFVGGVLGYSPSSSGPNGKKPDVINCTISNEDVIFEKVYSKDSNGLTCIGGVVGHTDGKIERCFVKSGRLMNKQVVPSSITVGGVAGRTKEANGCQVYFTNRENTTYLSQSLPYSIYVVSPNGGIRVSGIALSSKISDCKYDGASLLADSTDTRMSNPLYYPCAVGGMSAVVSSTTSNVDSVKSSFVNVDGIITAHASNYYCFAGGLMGSSLLWSDEKISAKSSLVLVDKIDAICDAGNQTSIYDETVYTGGQAGDVVCWENVNVEKCYTTDIIDLTATTGTYNTAILKSENRIKTVSFQKSLLGLSEYQSIDYINENPDAVWLLEEGELPDLYYYHLNDITISDEIENGTVSIDKTKAVDGENVTVATTPNDGYVLNKVYVDGVEQDGTTFVVDGNDEVYVTFAEEIPVYDVSITADKNASASLVNADVPMFMSLRLMSYEKDSSITANEGEEIHVNTVADSDYTVDNIYVNGEEVVGNSFILTEDSVVTLDVTSISTDVVATTNDAEDVGSYFAVVSGSISGDDENAVKYIRYWSADNTEMIYTTDVESGAGEYSIELMDLDSETTYYYQMTEFGEIKSFTTCSEPIDEHTGDEDGGYDDVIEEDTEISVTGVKLNKTSSTLTVGGTETLIATVLPSNASNKNVTWSSSKTSVATVDNGVVTAVGAGTATITVTTEQGSYLADCTVTVTSVVDENSPAIKVNNSKGYIGKTVDVVINVENNPGIAILGFNVNYDNTAMTLKSATLGEIFSGELECNTASVPFVFNVYSGSENKTNDGKLVTLQFEIKPDCAEGDYAISLSDIEALNIAENDVHFDAVNGTITVTNSIPGDVTGDGKVTRGDLLRLAKSFSGFEVEMDMAAADVTGDGKVTRGDLLRLAKHFSGFDVELGK